MNAIKKLAVYLQQNAYTETGRILNDFVLSIDTDRTIALGDLYRLPGEEFDMVLNFLRQWRLHRHMQPSLRDQIDSAPYH